MGAPLDSALGGSPTETPMIDMASALPVRTLVGSYIRAEMPLDWAETMKYDGRGLRPRTPAELVEVLEAKCKEFEAFVRDHRSQDEISLTVVREYENRCSKCDEKWDVDPDTQTCGFCGEAVASSSQETPNG